MTGKQLPLSAELASRPSPGVIEEETYLSGFRYVAGLDEVGRGPLAGPVVAAAVVLPRGFSNSDVKDSKLLSAGQREKLVPLIKKNAVSWGIGIAEVEEIDRINILKASLRAMVRAFQVLQPLPDCLLIDGTQMIPADFFQPKMIPAQRLPKQRAIIKGDQLCYSIAAASILAKVARDAMMTDLDKNYPEYGFVNHKGYSCLSHLEALRRFGPSPIHRRSFASVREVCPKSEVVSPLFLYPKEER
jgi:ribonuclease HII